MKVYLNTDFPTTREFGITKLGWSIRGDMTILSVMLSPAEPSCG